jgi:DNA repair photolyase
MSRIRDMRHGRNYDATFGKRMKGEGVWADLIRQRFSKASARLGMDGRKYRELRTDLFVAPGRSGPQLKLF